MRLTPLKIDIIDHLKGLVLWEVFAPLLFPNLFVFGIHGFFEVAGWYWIALATLALLVRTYDIASQLWEGRKNKWIV
jgi:hypothetical protein